MVIVYPDTYRYRVTRIQADMQDATLCYGSEHGNQCNLGKSLAQLISTKAPVLGELDTLRKRSSVTEHITASKSMKRGPWRQFFIRHRTLEKCSKLSVNSAPQCLIASITSLQREAQYIMLLEHSG